VARELVQAGDYRRAYGLVSDSGLSTGFEFSEAEFLAGWIALRHLKAPTVALAHFKKLEAGVSRPISLARARYWKARCYEASGDPASAVEQYKLAAQAPESFYGQIALARIDASPILHVNDAAVDASAVRDDFEKEELVRAMRVLADLGQVNILRIFALREQELHPDAAHAKILAQTMVDLGFREIAVRVAKNASYAGMPMLQFTHPVISLPPYSGAGGAPDPAYILGLIRQETEFDPDAISRSGARGLMQLMPASAKTDAGRAGLAWRPNDLTADPNYNIQLGMAEFQGYVADWNGSLVLAIASYNAGRNNVKKWLATNGDPRLPAIDPIDWIESIPFGETRNYVQRVLENAQIYRNRLGGRDQPLRILPDLYAPATPAVKPLSAFPP
jgi:soluble lytic murein transglycosylase